MNITAGVPVERGKNLEELNPKEYITKLLKEGFSGYICVATHGKMGLEEGIVVLHNSLIVAADYQYFFFNKEYGGQDAYQRTLNSFLAPLGIIDVYSLTAYQVQLVQTLNEEHNLPAGVGADGLVLPAVYSYEFEDKLRETVPGEDVEMTKEEMLKRLGITRYAGSKTTRAELEKMSKQDMWEEEEK